MTPVDSPVVVLTNFELVLTGCNILEYECIDAIFTLNHIIVSVPVAIEGADYAVNWKGLCARNLTLIEENKFTANTIVDSNCGITSSVEVVTA